MRGAKRICVFLKARAADIVSEMYLWVTGSEIASEKLSLTRGAYASFHKGRLRVQSLMSLTLIKEQADHRRTGVCVVILFAENQLRKFIKKTFRVRISGEMWFLLSGGLFVVNSERLVNRNYQKTR